MKIVKPLVFIAMLFADSVLAAVQTVHVYVDDGYPPYAFVENGKLQGYYPDIVRKVDELIPDYKIEMTGVAWKRALAEAESGRSHYLLPPYNNSKARPWMGYSDPILEETITMFCKKGAIAAANPKFPDDFTGKTIIVNAGFALGNTFSAAREKNLFNVIEEKTTERALIHLALRDGDCVANDRLVVNSALEKLPEHAKTMNLIESAKISSEKGYLGFATSHTPPWHADFMKKFNDALAIVLKTYKPKQ